MAFKINKLDCKINRRNLYSGRVCDIGDFLKITMNDFHLTPSIVFYPFVKDWGKKTLGTKIIHLMPSNILYF